ncbi:MAG TPA: cytochrome c3 family protein [Methylomirabilota bacterium]|nr:cytochrome c3 family protein [Methylomirabilota bacterium]
MSAIFPKWTNWLPLWIVIILAVVGGVVTVAVTFYFTPKYTRVGYQPVQPVPFSHKVHAGELGMDCRYCHSGVEKSWVANIPAASTCMICHNQVLKDDPRLAIVRAGATNNTPIPWVQVHITPDYVYFNHSVHVTRGISCVECHGRIDQMDEVRHAKSFSMSFCLNCHRAPAEHIRPVDKVTDLGWTWSTNGVEAAHLQTVEGKKLVEHMRVESLQSCSACHR